jgi:hypothetical protein
MTCPVCKEPRSIRQWAVCWCGRFEACLACIETHLRECPRAKEAIGNLP